MWGVLGIIQFIVFCHSINQVHILFDHVFRSFHIRTIQASAMLFWLCVSMDRQILGWYYQNGPPKFIMNLLCPLYNFITPTVSINQFPDTGVC